MLTLLFIGLGAFAGGIIFGTLQSSNGFGTGTSIKIEGGTDAKKGDAPWQVAMLDDQIEYSCGGTLLSKRVVVTAAHCITIEDPMTVGVGGLERAHFDDYIAVKQWIRHPGYSGPRCIGFIRPPNLRDCTDDIAIVILAKDAQLDPSALPAVQVANLPSHDIGPNAHSGKTAQVSGWGRLSQHGQLSRKLQKLDVVVTDQATCINMWKNHIKYDENVMLCAGLMGHSIGRADSGGPLVNKERAANILWGIASIGDDDPTVPQKGVYTRVADYVTWIRAKAREAGYPLP